MQYNSPLEFAEALKKNITENKDREPWKVLEAMINRWDTIRWVNAWDMIDWSNEFYNAIWQILTNPVKNIDLSMFTEDELNLKEPEPEVEITDSNSIIKSSWKEPVEKKELWSERNYDILKNFYERYMQLVSAKKDLVTEYNWWKWLPSGSEKKIDYENKLNILNNQLKEMEDWEELKNIITSIKEDWLWEKWEEWDSMPNHRLDVIMSKKSEDNEPRSWLKQNIFWDKLDDSVKWWFKIWFNERVDKYLSSKKWEHWTSEKWNKIDTNKDWANKKKLQIISDKSSFWEDISGKWWEEYLNRRNKLLISQLEKNGITSKEEIDAYLNQYPSWKNAKQEWKDNTLNKLSEWIKEKQTAKKEDTKEQPKEEKKEEPTNKNEWKKWNIVKEWVKNRINFETSNDSPLNWEEDDNKETKSDTKNNKTATKRQEVKNTLKSSPTITWLLKSKKK